MSIKYPKKVFVFTAFLLFMGVVSWYFVLFKLAAHSVETFEPEAPNSFGLDEPLGEKSLLLGDLYLMSMPPAVDGTGMYIPYSYKLSLEDKEASLIWFDSLRDYQPQSEVAGFGIAPSDGNITPQSWQPYYLDRTLETMTPLANVSGYWVNDLQASPDHVHYAYTYATEEMPSPDMVSLKSWHISIHNKDTGAVLTLDEASDPTWINGGKDLLYLSHDGVRRYNLATQSSTLVWEGYLPFNNGDDLVATPDSQTVLLTVPYINGHHMISVLSFVDRDSMAGLLNEQGRIVSDSVVYSHPVVSPDGLFYAVVASTPADDTYTRFTDRVEIRTLGNAVPIATYDVPGSLASGFSLDAWFLPEYE